MLPHYQTLYVTMRAPWDGSMYRPVGRLRELTDDSGKPSYEFVYIHGAHEAAKDGFRPFLEFPRLDKVYESCDLFPLFMNRLMPKSRPDYVAYVQRLGLVPSDVRPLDLLGRSMGARATDAIELFPMPARVEEMYVTFFLLRGIRHRTPEQQQRIDRLLKDEHLNAKPETGNPHDSSAVQLLTTDDGTMVGYVPSYLAEDTVSLCAQSNAPRIIVDRVNPAPAPVQHRVLCRLEACWPEGFEPFSTQRYQPISTVASAVNQAPTTAVV